MDRALLSQFLHQYPFQPATGYWRAIEIAHVLQHTLPSGRGLDVGCGDGRLTALVAERTGWTNVVGVDPDAAEIELASRTGIYADLHATSAAEIPEPDCSFDWAFSNSVLEHVDDIDGILREVSRLLRPSGHLILTVPGPDFHHCLRGPLVGGVTRSEYLSRLDIRLAHRRYWGVETWHDHLAAVGIDVVESSVYMSRAQVRRWETLSRATAGLLHTISGRRLAPIQIQRQLSMRHGQTMPRPAAAALASIIPFGSSDEQGPFGCVRISGIRSAA